MGWVLPTAIVKQPSAWFRSGQEGHAKIPMPRELCDNPSSNYAARQELNQQQLAHTPLLLPLH